MTHSSNRPRLLRTAGVLAVVVALTAIGGSLAGLAQGPAQPPAGLVVPQAMPDCLAFGEARTAVHPRTGTVRFIGMEPGRTILQPRRDALATPESAALSYLSVCGALFGLSDAANELVVTRNTPVDSARRVVRVQQRHRGVPILGGELNVHLDASNNVMAVAGETLPSTSLDVVPTIDPGAAVRTARDLVAAAYGAAPDGLTISTPALWVYSPSLISPRPGRPSLVWRMEVVQQGAPPVRELVLVDAHQGSVSLNFSQIHTARNRMTHTANNTTTLPGSLVCNESNPSCAGGDADAVAAHVYAGDTYDYYLFNYGRDSLNNAGMPLTSTVHYGQVGYQNAFWNGTQMAYGDGFSQSDDVVGHELTHGVTQFTSNLFYYYQSGAINESLSDVFGEFIDQVNGRGNDTPAVKWLLGEDVPPGTGAIRNMANPPALGDPDKMTSTLYYTGSGDNGGVHFNSGVNNKAAYLMSDGGTFNGQTVAALGIAKTGRIYYEVETNFLTSGSDYADLHEFLYQACTNLVGTAGIALADCQQVRNATLAVEMNLQPVPGFNPDVPLCTPGQAPVTVFYDGIESGIGNFTSSNAQRWYLIQGYAHTGTRSFYGDDYSYFANNTSDTTMAMTNNVMVPANAYLHFAHAFGLQTPDRDGGVVEYSTNGGASWTDVAPLVDGGGYRGPIAAGFGNPLAGRSAFIGVSHGYISTRLNLSSLSGQNVRFRWRLGLDATGFGELGWVVDDVRIYQCSGATLTTVAPNSGAQGAVNLNVAVTGQGTHFAQGSTTGNFGAGITVNSVTVTNATQLTANVTIASDAALGARDVSFTTGGELAAKLNAFTVTQGPQLVSITPNRGQPGQSNLAVSITGVFTNFVQGQTTANFGAGITTLSTTVQDATHATAVITIGAGAAPGPRTVTVTTGSVAAVAPNRFLVRPLSADTQVYAYVLGRRYSPGQTPPGTGVQTVNVINTATNAIVATIPAGQGCYCVGPDGLAVLPDGTRVYVANEMGNNVTIIDALSNTAIGTVPVGTGPIAVAAHPDSSRVYVVNGSGTTSVSVLDTITNAVVATIPLGGGIPQARGVTISPDGSRLYVTTYGTGFVKVINTATNTIIATITTGNVPLGLDLSPNGSRLYVATFPSAPPGGTLGPPWMSVIDAATNALIGNLGGLTGFPADVAVTPDGGRAIVTSSQSSPVYDLATYGIVANLPPPATGSGIEFTPDGTRAYIANYGSVAVVNAQTNAIIGTIPMTDVNNGRPIAVAMGPGPIRTLSLSGSLTFGNRWVGSTSYGNLVVSNAGNAPLTINSITFPPGFDGAWGGPAATATATAAGPMVVPPGGARNVVVTFTPTSTAAYGGQIVVSANQTGGSTSIAVAGTGITFPLPAADFDDDGKADIGVYRRSNGLWAIIQSGGGSKVVGWGDPGAGDMPVAADYDGDGKADVAVYRQTTGEWFIIRSTNSTLLYVAWGSPGLGDVPVPADYDGDGKADIAVYRTSTAQWFIIRSTNSTLLQVAWGTPALGDVPVPADFDGDGKADIGVHRLSTGEWFIIRSTNSTLLQVAWGAPALGDIPVVGDYDGDGKADVAVYRLSTGGWFVIRSTNSTLLAVDWGAPSLGDIPVPGDYDGDGKIDVGVYRKTTGEWFIIRSTNGTLLQVGWGAPTLGDAPPQYK